MLTPFAFAPDGWFQLCAFGDFPHADAGVTQRCDMDAFSAITANFNEAASAANFPGVLVDFEHTSFDEKSPKTEAAGWITALQTRGDGTHPGDGLYAQTRWSDAGHAALTGGRYRFVSPVWLKADCAQVEPGILRPQRLYNAGLTNQANIRGMAPITNSEPRTKPQASQIFINRHLAAIVNFHLPRAVEALVNRELSREEEKAIFAKGGGGGGWRGMGGGGRIPGSGSHDTGVDTPTPSGRIPGGGGARRGGYRGGSTTPSGSSSSPSTPSAPPAPSVPSFPDSDGDGRPDPEANSLEALNGLIAATEEEWNGKINGLLDQRTALENQKREPVPPADYALTDLKELNKRLWRDQAEGRITAESYRQQMADAEQGNADKKRRLRDIMSDIKDQYPHDKAAQKRALQKQLDADERRFNREKLAADKYNTYLDTRIAGLDNKIALSVAERDAELKKMKIKGTEKLVDDAVKQMERVKKDNDKKARQAEKDAIAKANQAAREEKRQKNEAKQAEKDAKNAADTRERNKAKLIELVSKRNLDEAQALFPEADINRLTKMFPYLPPDASKRDKDTLADRMKYYRRADLPGLDDV